MAFSEMISHFIRPSSSRNADLLQSKRMLEQMPDARKQSDPCAQVLGLIMTKVWPIQTPNKEDQKIQDKSLGSKNVLFCSLSSRIRNFWGGKLWAKTHTLCANLVSFVKGEMPVMRRRPAVCLILLLKKPLKPLGSWFVSKTFHLEHFHCNVHDLDGKKPLGKKLANILIDSAIQVFHRLKQMFVPRGRKMKSLTGLLSIIKRAFEDFVTDVKTSGLNH